MKKVMILTAAMVSIYLTACKKGSSSSTPATTNLLVNTWLQTANKKYSTAVPNPVPEDLFTSQPDCYKDNLLVLQANNTWEINEGASKCSPSDPQVRETGTYTSNGSGTSLTLTSSAGTTDFEVQQVTATYLKLKYTYYGGVAYAILEYTKK